MADSINPVGGWHNGGVDSGAGTLDFSFVRRYPHFVYVEIRGSSLGDSRTAHKASQAYTAGPDPL
jgi:hypothetical protein